MTKLITITMLLSSIAYSNCIGDTMKQHNYTYNHAKRTCKDKIIKTCLIETTKQNPTATESEIVNACIKDYKEA